MKLLLLIALLSPALFSNAQTGVFTDARDNEQYKTIVIAGNRWFRENLRFQTSKSFCPNFNKNAADCNMGNYYSNSELNFICPDGWHVATTTEWESFISILLKSNNINAGLIKYDTSSFVKNHFSISLPGTDLFRDTLLQLVPTGWIEGDKMKNNGGLTLWAVDLPSRDEKYHFHIVKDGLIKHSHEHHILDKAKKIRKFPVRCVCDTAK